LGPDGTFSSEAAENYIKRNGLNVVVRYYTTIDSCFLGLRIGEVEKILVPWLNSVVGYIPETIQNLSGYKICDREILPISLHLAGIGQLDSLSYVHSKKEAVQQCRIKLSQKDIKVIFEDSTAIAAARVKNHPNRAAIVSKRASEIYGLQILEPNIQDSQDNKTEFIVVE